jgi:hypothetical protein
MMVVSIGISLAAHYARATAETTKGCVPLCSSMDETLAKLLKEGRFTPPVLQSERAISGEPPVLRAQCVRTPS